MSIQNNENIYMLFYHTLDGFYGQKILALSKSDCLQTFNEYYSHVVHEVLVISSYKEIVDVVEKIVDVHPSNKIEISEDNKNNLIFKEISENSESYENSLGLLRDELLEMFMDLLENMNIDKDDILISDNIELE